MTTHNPCDNRVNQPVHGQGKEVVYAVTVAVRPLVDNHVKAGLNLDNFDLMLQVDHGPVGFNVRAVAMGDPCRPSPLAVIVVEGRHDGSVIGLRAWDFRRGVGRAEGGTNRLEMGGKRTMDNGVFFFFSFFFKERMKS